MNSQSRSTEVLLFRKQKTTKRIMQYDKFVGKVQHCARLASQSEAVTAIRATLETLSERLAGGEAKDVAAQLPKEIGVYLRSSWENRSDRLSLREFYHRVSMRENVALPKAIHHARCVIAVLQKSVSKGEMDDIRSQLPAEFGSLFDLKPEERPASPGRTTMIKDIETHHPETISPGASLLEAAQKMKKLDVGMLPVCDGEQLVGMLTDRDIAIRATAEGRDPRATTVQDIMSADVVSCYEDQDLAEAARVMEERQIRRVPVKDRSQRLVGIISLGDLAVRNRNDRLAGEVLERVSEHLPIAATAA
jgi:uncharacterized protein (DUF2267 family)/CBS domain-containing protein